jgi:uncharacterized delta-60 repeat protein
VTATPCFAGALDPGFGNGGKVLTPIASSLDEATAVAVLPSGAIVVAGSTWNGGFQWDIALARYLANGSLDPSFGSGGKVDTVATGSQSGYAMTVQADGRIVVAGPGQSGNRKMRVRATWRTAPPTRPSRRPHHCRTAQRRQRRQRQQPDGEIAVAGYSENGSGFAHVALVRQARRAQPRRDVQQRRYRHHRGRGQRSYAIVRQPDGKPVGGTTDGGSNATRC